MGKKKFEIGKLYSWVPREPDEPEYMSESYVVWNPTRNDIWKQDYDDTGLLHQNTIITVLECHKTTNGYDLKILSTCGVCGWVRVGKEFYNDWQAISL